MKVLAIDDSKTILTLIRDILSAHKYEVMTADNGAMGLDAYAKFRPDIVTLDLAMPVMDGYETLRKILAIDRQANVIMLTASEQQEILERCMEKGAIGYIIKPFTAKELVSAIDGAWKAGSAKNVAAMFSLARNKIEVSIRKLAEVLLPALPAASISVTLSGLQVIRQQAAIQVPSPAMDITRIKVIPNVTEDLHVEVPNASVGYITEFGGQQKGAIISFIKINDLGELLKGSIDADVLGKAAEFFHVFNSKILSELSNSTHLILTQEPIQFYDHSRYKDSDFGSEVTKAAFDIMVGQKNIPIEVQLWFNSGQIFRGGF
jgi:two-component system chemotaxis response regulator CheY